jgi:hypothetical protein
MRKKLCKLVFECARGLLKVLEKLFSGFLIDSVASDESCPI